MSKRIPGLVMLIVGAVLVAGCSSPAAGTASSATATSPATAPDTASTAAAPASSGNGIRYVLVPDASQAMFSVREQLARRPLPSDAVGTTKAVSGTLTIQPDGTVISSASHFTVDLSTLQTDQKQRDNFIKRNTLQTSQYPTAEFVPRQATGLPNPLPASGNVTFQLTGDLTIHGVTHPVTWNVTATVDGQGLSGKATTQVKFEDFGMSPPQAFVVLSVEDNIRLEFDFRLQRTS